MAKELSRVGAVGLELTREEVVDVIGTIDAIVRKAQCREVNEDVIDILDEARNKLDEADTIITAILEEDD
jgi:hypothetical protein